MKRQIITIGLIVILALSVQISLIVDSKPGFGGSADCANCHNEPGSAYNSTYMDNELILDGNDTEAFWEETFARRMMIPVSSQSEAGERNETMVETVFAQNDTHLFLKITWEAPRINGTDDDAYEIADGVAVMFNINVTEFTSANFGGMETSKAGEATDVYIWKPAASATGTQSGDGTPISVPGNTYDYATNVDGWVKTEDNDVKAAADYGKYSSFSGPEYMVEFVRPLVTDDVNDVQFEFNGYYDFALAIFNETAASGHMVSFEHQVYVHNQAIPPETTTVFSTVQRTVTTTESAGFTAIFAVGLFSMMVTTIIIRSSKAKQL